MDPELFFWGFVWTNANFVPLFLIAELFILFVSIEIVIVFDQFGRKLQLPVDPAADWKMMLNHKWTDIHYLYLCSTDKICGLIFAPHNTNVTKWILCQNSVKRNKTAYIVNCHVEQCQEYSTLQRWINLSLIHLIRVFFTLFPNYTNRCKS